MPKDNELWLGAGGGGGQAYVRAWLILVMMGNNDSRLTTAPPVPAPTPATTAKNDFDTEVMFLKQVGFEMRKYCRIQAGVNIVRALDFHYRLVIQKTCSLI